MNHLPNRQQRLHHFALTHLRAAVRQEWQLGLLALVGVAPGVATVLAWSNLAIALREQRGALSLGWLLPAEIIDLLGAEGVLVGAGIVALLIGCLGLTNAYLAGLERRAPALILLRTLGLRRQELHQLLLLEALVIGLLGSGVGVLLGVVLSWVTWHDAARYLALPATYHMAPVAPLAALGIGLVAVLLFLQTAARLTPLDPPFQPLTPHPATAMGHLVARNSWLGAFYGLLLALVAGLVVLPLKAAVTLVLLAGLAAVFLNGGSWLLIQLYWRLPLSPQQPLWTLAVQGLARHPNHTAGMTLALATGAYAVGMAALSWLASDGMARFPFWVAALVLLAGATLVFTVAGLSVLERRTELSMLRALGARRHRLWQLILLEYAIVAIGGGSIGAFMALVNWAASGQRGQWLVAVALVAADLVGALLSAWVGALPVLWQLSKHRVGDGLSQ